MITRTAIKGNLKLLQQVLLGNSTPLGATCYTFFSFQLIGFYTKATEGFPRLETAIVKCNLARSNFIWFHSCQLTHCAKPTIFVFWRQFQFRISGLKWPQWPQRPPWPQVASSCLNGLKWPQSASIGLNGLKWPQMASMASKGLNDLSNRNGMIFFDEKQTFDAVCSNFLGKSVECNIEKMDWELLTKIISWKLWFY